MMSSYTQSIEHIRRVLIGLTILCLVWCAALAYGAAPMAGTVIENQATNHYTDPSTGEKYTLQTNIVRVIVQPLESLLLTADNTVACIPGDTVYTAHTLQNTGNIRSTYKLTYQPIDGSNFIPSNLRLYVDTNGDGVVNNGEPYIANGGSVELDPGEKIQLVFASIIPAGIPYGDKCFIQLQATTVLSAVSAINRDTLRIGSSVELVLTKAALQSTAIAGETVDFSIQGANTGAVDALPTTIQVNGHDEKYVMCVDDIPANTTFSEAHGNGSGTVLYHKLGDPQGSYYSSVPADISAVDRVAYGLKHLNAGERFEFVLRVKLNQNINTNIKNTAQLSCVDPATSGSLYATSNAVVVAVDKKAPQISFFWDSGYVRPTELEAIGNHLFLEVVAAECNLDASVAETIHITIKSTLTGDTETVTATETGPNTGIFRIDQLLVTADASNSSSVPGNGIIETVPNDKLTATFTDQYGQTVTDFVTVDPYCVVFDSRTNAPVANAQVSLVDVNGASNGGDAGGLAKVFAMDGVTPVDNPVTTGSDGVFRFPYVVAGTYKIIVTPVGNYVFPSTLPASSLPAGRSVDPVASYGGQFTTTAASLAIALDIPLDFNAGSGFILEKNSSKETVEAGETIDYTLRLKNETGTTLTDIVVKDTLPKGEVYIPKSTYVNKIKADDPVVTNESNMAFSVAEMTPGSSLVVTYRVGVKAGTRESVLKNTAKADAKSSYGPISSNIGVAEVRLRMGVFTTQGVVIGRVFIDDNSNGIVDKTEQGMPGVRIYLDDGSFVITDGEGKYSLYALTAGTHVLKVDKESLPENTVLLQAGHESVGDPGSSFVEIRLGEMRKVNFAIRNTDEKIKQEAAARKKALTKVQGETTLALAATLPVTPNPVDISETRSTIASGYTSGSNESIVNNLPQPGSSAGQGSSSLPTAPVRPAQTTPMSERIPTFTNDLGFVDLNTGDVLPMPIWNVVVKGRIGNTFILKVNGKVISEDQVGAKHTYFIKNIEVWEFIGVEFKPGNNIVTVTQRDQLGNDRGEAKINVTTSGALSKIQIIVPEGKHVADTKVPVPVTVKLVDSNGILVQTRTPITLENDSAEWNVSDLNPLEQGVQVFLDGGEAKFELMPPHEACVTNLRVSSGLMSSKMKLEFVPNLRPMLAAGVVDVGVAQNKSTLLSHGQASVFMKGRVNDDTLLTLAYQTNKDKYAQLFRDIQPDEFYPVYGDSSIKGFDGQTSAKTYARLEKRQSFLMYGDFSTSASDEGRHLSNYNRSLTGVMAHYETGANAFNIFGSYDSLRQNIVEVLANGTSGPYSLGSGFMVDNSEQVEVIVRDRNQPSVILKTTTMTRYLQYTVDLNKTTILFKTPVPSFDANMNPISIRVTYEVDSGGPKYVTAGVDGRLSLRKNLVLRGTLVNADIPNNAWTMSGVSAEWTLNANSKLVGEIAQTSSDLQGTGTGQRIEYSHESSKLQARVMAAQTDMAFDNTAASIGKGRTEVSSKISYLHNQNTRFMSEAIQSEDRSLGTNRIGLSTSVEQSLSPELRLELGFRHAEETKSLLPTSGSNEPTVNFTSFRAKLTSLIPKWASASFYSEYEQDISDASKNVLALGGEYLFANRGRLYARQEFNSTLSGRYLLNANQSQQTSVIGIDTDYLGSAHVFSEYRSRDAFSGRETEAAIGLRNQWELNRGLRVNASLERIEPVDGKATSASTAVTSAVEYTGSEKWKGSARVEYRVNSGNKSWLTTLGTAVKISEDWTALDKAILQISKSDTDTQTQARLIIGAAYRESSRDRWNGLAKYELRYDSAPDRIDGGTERSHILSADVNYQPNRYLESGTHLAMRISDNTLGSLSTTTRAMLLQQRISFNPSLRTQLSLISSNYWNDSLGGDTSSIGIEGGFMLHRNLWLTAGYNFSGFDDDKLVDGNYTGKGAYLRLRFKFDESVIGQRPHTDATSPADASPAQ